MWGSSSSILKRISLNTFWTHSERSFLINEILPFSAVIYLFGGVPATLSNLIEPNKGPFLNSFLQFSSVQSISRVQLFVTPWTVACQASLSITNARSLLKLISIESVMPSNHLILCHPLVLLPSIFPSIRVFSQWVSSLHQAWSISFGISHSNEYSFRIHWVDLIAVQGTLKSLHQHHSSKASILQCSAFFIVQISYTHMTSGEIIASTIWTLLVK